MELWNCQIIMESPPEMTILSQFKANWKSFLQLAKTMFEYSESQCTPECPEFLKAKNHDLASSGVSFAEANNLTEAAN